MIQNVHEDAAKIREYVAKHNDHHIGSFVDIKRLVAEMHGKVDSDMASAVERQVRENLANGIPVHEAPAEWQQDADAIAQMYKEDTDNALRHTTAQNAARAEDTSNLDAQIVNLGQGVNPPEPTTAGEVIVDPGSNGVTLFGSGEIEVGCPAKDTFTIVITDFKLDENVLAGNARTPDARLVDGCQFVGTRESTSGEIEARQDEFGIWKGTLTFNLPGKSFPGGIIADPKVNGFTWQANAEDVKPTGIVANVVDENGVVRGAFQVKSGDN